MPQNLATLITRQQVINALEHIISTRISLRPSTGYDLVYKNQRFPPKEVVRKAAEIAGLSVKESSFFGGEATNGPLRKLGFTIVPKSFTDTQYFVLGSVWEVDGKREDQLNRFLQEGIWINAKEDDYSYDLTLTVKVGAQVAIKSTWQQDGVSFLRIKARGVVTKNLGDGERLEVSWEDGVEPYDLPKLGRYRRTIEQVTNEEDVRQIFFLTTAEEAQVPAEKPVEVNQPLNQILYGPPGTGKTYTTITKAAHILTGEDFTDRYEEARQAYEDALGNRVEFITFHQNYSYEDFVVGIRPNVLSSQLSFIDHKGVFYKICKKARDNWDRSRPIQTSIVPSFEDVWEVFLEPLAEEGGEIEIQNRTRGSFHITALNERNLSFRKQSGGEGHRLSIETIEAIYNGMQYRRDGLGTYYEPLTSKLHDIAESLKKPAQSETRQNYVLIIDEINRANISRVFGELITLLEEDKRWGADHAMEVMLPTGERFSVPKNLYLIGTMNTADKSIALVDIALRRRFHFEPMFPNPGLDGVQFREFLTALNEAILKEKGPDFLIGHTYFMPAREGDPVEFVSLMNRKVIPLLNEYFYNEPGNTVYSLLNGKPGIPEGYAFRKDAYLGVQCERTNNAANGNPPA